MKNLSGRKSLFFFLSFLLIYSSTYARTLSEVSLQVHGGDPLNPTTDSMMGRYLANSGARTIVRAFPTNYGGNGDEKLAVALSDQTYTEFINQFGTTSENSKNIFFVHHTPHSGTFHFLYKGRIGSYARLTSDAAFASPGTLIIPVILDDAEANRLQNFLDLALIDQNIARTPWRLQTEGGLRYSAFSAWVGCTNWVGQMPIGNQTVRSYIFPSGDNGENPNSQILLHYQTPEGFTPEQEQVLRSVWRVPGYQQFGEMLYPEGHRKGEFTNIGWIVHSLLARVGLDRVPFMFYSVGSHEAELAINFPLYTSPY